MELLGPLCYTEIYKVYSFLFGHYNLLISLFQLREVHIYSLGQDSCAQQRCLGTSY